jgi:hypothetical protein
MPRHGGVPRSRVSLDMHLLDPTALTDEIALENTFCVLERHLQNTAVNTDSLLNELILVPNLFAFVFSGKVTFSKI